MQPTTITIRFGLLGGSESYLGLQYELDSRGDPEVTATELATWLRRSWIPSVAITIDDQPLPLDESTVSASHDGLPEQLFLTQPLVLAIQAPIPADGQRHTLEISNNYYALHSEYQLEVLLGPGAVADVVRNDGASVEIRFETDPALPAGTPTLASFATIQAPGGDSWQDRLAGVWLWLVIALLAGAVAVWLVWARRRDQAPIRPAANVRQNHARRKKPVAVRTIEAPDE